LTPGPLRPLGEALRLLTLLPVPGLARDAPPRLERCAIAFPLVGLAVGASGVLAGLAAQALWGDPLLRALAVVIAGMALTGGLHQDGLADTCDGLLSWRPRERRLEILRDSRIGTMGVLGLASVLSLQVAALGALGDAWWRAALVAPVWGRWAAAWGLTRFEPARGDGAFRRFHDGVRRGDAALASASALLLVAAIWWPWGPGAGLAVVPVTLVLARRMGRSLGGLTGDTLGALCEVAVATASLALLAATRHLGAA